MKKLLNNSYRREIDTKINHIVHIHKVMGKTVLSRPQTSLVKRSQGNREFLDGVMETPPRNREIGHKLDENDALHIFKMKWEDLEIPPSAAAEQRFVEQFLHALKNKSLKFHSFGLGPAGVKALLQVLRTQTKYVFLDLSSNHMSDKGAGHVARYMCTNPPIIHLDLRSNAITNTGFIKLFRALRRNSFLASLDISAVGGIERNKIGLQGCKELANMLLENEIISTLNISTCGVSIEGCAFLSLAFSRNKGLVSVDISANKFGHSGTNKLFSEDNSFGKIENFNISRNDISDLATASLCKQIKLSQSLQTLDLSHNKFTKFFLKQLQISLVGKNIQTLDISHNKFGPDCFIDFHDIIKETSSIQTLNLAANPIRDKGAKWIAKALEENTSIRSLDLSDAFITDKGAMRIAEVLEVNQTLERLILTNNSISDDGAIKIMKAVEKNDNIAILSLQNNEMTDKSAPHFLELMQKNTTLIDIDVEYNDFSYKTYALISETVANHKKDLSSNITKYARRHIEKLKKEEEILFDTRKKVEKRTKKVRKGLEEKQQKKEFYMDLRKSRTQAASDNEKRLEELKNESERMKDYRIDFQKNFAKFMSSAEAEKMRAENEYAKMCANRQHAASRVHRSENQKLETQVYYGRVIDDLKLQLSTVKLQLVQMLQEIQLQKDQLIKQEKEKVKAEQEERQKRKEKEKADRALKKVPGLRTISELQKMSKGIPKPMKVKKKKPPSRPKTAADAPIVRPELPELS